MHKLLSLDGGGLRFIIPACALVALEEQTGKLTRDIFDFVAGTSAGALGAAAIAAGIPASVIYEVFTERAQEIFSGAVPCLEFLENGYRYQSRNIQKVACDVLGPAAKWALNDSPIRILLTGLHVSGRPMYFVQDRLGYNSCEMGKLSIVDCAVASAAAPTYFNSWYVSPLGGRLIGHCFDGGVGGLANPVHRACIEAFRYDSFTPATTRIVSLGTGWCHSETVNPPANLPDTISLIIDSLLGAANDEQSALVNRYYPGIMRRLNPELPHAIDMADISAIPTLIEVGRAAAKLIDWKRWLEICESGAMAGYRAL